MTHEIRSQPIRHETYLLPMDTRLVHPEVTLEVVADMVAERGRQDGKWNEQNHDPSLWVTIDAEEFGEFAEAALTFKFGKITNREKNLDHAYEEAIHTAAVAIAAAEAIKRNREALLTVRDGTNSDEWDVYHEFYNALLVGREDEIETETETLNQMYDHYAGITSDCRDKAEAVLAELDLRASVAS